MRRPRPSCARARLCALALGLGALAPAGCGDTVQSQPIAHNTLESLLMASYPVYWLGDSFERLAITEATHDESGAYAVQYGDCKVGGQGTCVPPLRVVTSPDNSFLPVGSAPHRTALLRGIPVIVAQRGRTIEIPTGGVVVSIYAQAAQLADEAAETVVPINRRGAPGEPLPARLPDTGFASRPLPGVQVPSAPAAPG